MKRSIFVSLTLFASIIFVGIASAQINMSWEKERFAYVTNEGAHNLMVLDLEKEKTIATLKTDTAPHALVFDNDGKGYVNNRGSNILTVIDGNSFKVIKNILLPATSFQLALSPDKKILAVGYKDALIVSFIDTKTLELIASVPIGKQPVGTKTTRMKHPYWSNDGKYLYVGDNVNQTVVKVDVQSFNIAVTIPVAGTVHHFALDKDGKKLYVAHEKNQTGGTSVSVIEVATDKMIKNIPIPLAEGEEAKGHHGAFDNSGRYFFFCNEGGKTVAVIDTKEMGLVKTLQAGMGAGHAYVSKNGNFAYIVPHKDNIVTVIDLSKMEVTKEIVVGKGKKLGHSGYLTSDSNYLYVINSVDNIVAKIDLNKQLVTSIMPVGSKALIMVVR